MDTNDLAQRDFKYGDRFGLEGGSTDMGETDSLRATALLETVRRRAPRVHCLTNSVVRNFTANTLLALGVVPSMTSDDDEVEEFVRTAGSLLVNLGMLDQGISSAIERAISAARSRNKPWVLDPVFVDRSNKRRDFALECLAAGPSVLRLNPAEASALGRTALQDAVDAGTIVAMSGTTDHIYGSGRQADIATGHPLMAKITGTGCALGAVLAAFLTISDDRFEAVASGSIIFGSAGAIAGAKAEGPGSFQYLFLDTLHRLSEEDMRQERIR